MKKSRVIAPLYRLLTVATILVFCANTSAGQSRLNVVTTLPDFASIAEEIGGEQVSVFAIATGYQDPHFVDPKPSYIVKLSRADMFVSVGLDLEQGWVPPLLNSARNPNILPGGDGYVDASAGIPLLQVPTSTSREQGDIHIQGNPHYWLDPDRGRIIAGTIHAALVRLQPESEALFTQNLAKFNLELDGAAIHWAELMAPFAGSKIMAYHNQWPYFEAAFGLEIVDFLEPKPGIPPSPSQLAKVIREMQRDAINVIIIAPYYSHDAADLVARNVGGTVVTLASSVGAFPQINTYRELFDYNVNLIAGALEAGLRP
ncbi:MAG: zinc/manganese transport system substrate-binding protein [Rhodothermales bacterium]